MGLRHRHSTFGAGSEPLARHTGDMVTVTPLTMNGRSHTLCLGMKRDLTCHFPSSPRQDVCIANRRRQDRTLPHSTHVTLGTHNHT